MDRFYLLDIARGVAAIAVAIFHYKLFYAYHLSSENFIAENEKENNLNSEEDKETNKEAEDIVEDSIESIPFISEPVKKKRIKSSK